MSVVDDHETAICNFCGTVIEGPHQRCPALDDGWCRP
jgi:rubrerythrin